MLSKSAENWQTVKIYLLWKLRTLVTPDFLLTASYGLFHCHINYGIILWGYALCCDDEFLMQMLAVTKDTNFKRAV